MVDAGFGITVLPLFALSALPTQSLIARELTVTPQRHRPPITARMIGWTKSEYTAE
jgi:hypothetical protein